MGSLDGLLFLCNCPVNFRFAVYVCKGIFDCESSLSIAFMSLLSVYGMCSISYTALSCFDPQGGLDV